jgi:hypothetical protein
VSREQNAGQNQNINIDSKSLETVERFKYWGTTSTNQNSIQEEIKSRLKSGNACYYLVQKHISSCSLSKNIKIANTSFERVEKFKYLGTTLTNHSIQEEIKSRLKPGNACYHSLQNLLSSFAIQKFKD